MEHYFFSSEITEQVLEKALSFCQQTVKSSQPDRRDIPVPLHEELELAQPSVTVLSVFIFRRDRNVPPIGLIVFLRSKVERHLWNLLSGFSYGMLVSKILSDAS
jgi:hypothetical protein